MNKCKFCGRKVDGEQPWHKPCWVSFAREVAETFCDEYCRFPRQCSSQDERRARDQLDRHCERCAMIKLVNLGI